MRQDEFAFFNRQLAVMLRNGIPLEGALKQLCLGMSGGALRAEIEQLEADLERGTPLTEALARRKLPEFYARMVEIGARSNDLPGVLTLLADHYERANALWNRLKTIESRNVRPRETRTLRFIVALLQAAVTLTDSTALRM